MVDYNSPFRLAVSQSLKMDKLTGPISTPRILYFSITGLFQGHMNYAVASRVKLITFNNDSVSYAYCLGFLTNYLTFIHNTLRDRLLYNPYTHLKTIPLE